MPVPNRPKKLDSEPVVSPAESVAYHGTDDTSPTGIVVCYTTDLLEYVIEEYDGTTRRDGFGTLHQLAITDGEIGVLGDFGVGAPATAIAIEERLATGATAILSIGYAGCLNSDINMGEFVVPDRALRDEGTSHHYREPSQWIQPPGDLTDHIRDHLGERPGSVHSGPTWTIDAVYQETTDEVSAYADAGILTVEMEAAAVFTIAAHRGATAASMFVVSDYLGPSDWEPKFHQTDEDMQRLMDTSIEMFAEYIQ